MTNSRNAIVLKHYCLHPSSGWHLLVKSGKGYVSGGIPSGLSQFWKKPPTCSSKPLWNIIKSLCRQAGLRQCGCVLSWHPKKKVWPAQASGLTCKPVTVCTNKAGVIRLIRSSPAGFLTWPVKLPLPLPDQHFRWSMIWSVGGNLLDTFLNIILLKRGFNHQCFDG